MKILLRQKGGLGNQLFQYAAGLFYAKKYKGSLEIIPEPVSRAVSFGHPRPFLLSNFCIASPIHKLTPWDALMCSVAPLKRPLAASARFASRTAFYSQRYAKDGNFVPDLPISRFATSIYLVGDFQAYRYVQGVRENILTEIRFRKPAVGKNLDVLEQIQAVESSVSLHVRRGDYAVRYYQRALPPSYYQEAMRTILQSISNPTFFVFSDDIAFAKEILPTGEHLVFVDHNDEASPHEDLRLMSSCSHNIIANSTLSWWGAWLNQKPERMVCAPANWQNAAPGFSYTDLVPPDWLGVAT